VLSIVLVMVGANFVSWALYQVQPVELFALASLAGCGLGVWLGRRMGWRRSWLLGVAVGAVADVAFFAAISQVDPAGLIEIAKVF
jgi:hypothetical protein